MKIANDFRKDKDKVYSEIIKLTEDYLQTIHEIGKTADQKVKISLKSKIQALHAYLEIKKSNFSAIENSLAKLESREPEQINLKFFWPPPYDFRMVTQ
jgi:Spy/CpxP family protein refolding chaperone